MRSDAIDRGEQRNSDTTILTGSEIEEQIKIIPEWKIIHEDSMNKLMREYAFINFDQVLTFTEMIRKLAEKEGHHPVIKSTWGKVTIYWWTHSMRGLKDKDFVLAMKCDKLYKKFQIGESTTS